MRDQVTPGDVFETSSDQRGMPRGPRDVLRGAAAASALAKRKAGVPTYSVPEAAALLSVSSEHLHRLIKADAFPALLLALGGSQGRYVVPAAAVERLLGETTAGTSLVDVASWTAARRSERAGGAA